MRVLVTGAAGFLGSHLCDRLVERGDVVTGLDNFSTGRRENIAGLARHPRFTMVEHDILDPFEGEFDRIYNLACPPSPAHYQRDPIGTVRICVKGLDNLLALAARTGARLFQASTAEVNGEPLVHPQPEDYYGNVNATGIRACYEEGKRAAECLCFDYARQRGVVVKVARIFNTYGPRMNPADGTVVANFVLQALRGEPITIYGTGEQTRSFCYVDDLIEGCLRLMESPAEVSGPINLGFPEEVSMRDFAALVTELTGAKSAVKTLPPVPDDPTRRWPDISKARQMLDWSPQVGLREGLRETIKYFETEVSELEH